MNQADLIDVLNEYLSGKLSAPVLTPDGTEDRRPVPAVILDNFDVDDVTFHNTHLAAVEETGTGQTDNRYFRFHYWARLDYLVRNESDVSAIQLDDQLRGALRPLQENPSYLDSDIREVRLRGGGGLNQTNVEDKESESHQAIRIRTFEQTNNLEDGFEGGVLDSITNSLNEGYGSDFTVTN